MQISLPGDGAIPRNMSFASGMGPAWRPFSVGDGMIAEPAVVDQGCSAPASDLTAPVGLALDDHQRNAKLKPTVGDGTLWAGAGACAPVSTDRRSTRRNRSNGATMPMLSWGRSWL